MQVIETIINDFIMPPFVIFLIILNIIRFIYWIKCRKIKCCEVAECPYHYFCRKWNQSTTELELMRLYALIEQYEAENTSALDQPNES